MDVKGKEIAVLGAGASGLGAARLARARGASVRAFDSGDPEKLAERAALFAEEGVELRTGDEALSVPKGTDLAVISPGIDPASPLARAFSGGKFETVGEIEFAWRFAKAPVVAVTGTNGKTTTTDLIATVLRAAGLRTEAAGNIGLPFSEVILKGEDCDVHTLELSSFQLEGISTFRPRVAVWMNFAPDHLDRYRSVEEYRAAKMRIFENQTEADWSVVKEEERFHAGRKQVTFSAFSHGADYRYEDHFIVGPEGPVLDFRKTALLGVHNAENMMAALAAAACLGLSSEKAVPALLSYRGFPHRCEPIATVGGIEYVNDSKATNLHAVESSLLGQEQPVILIAGGKDKGLDYRELRGEVAGKVRRAICLGEIADHIAEAWSDLVPCDRVATLEEAVALAHAAARAGETVLFSPGTSSFDMFRGYEERGEVFREAVQGLT